MKILMYSFQTLVLSAVILTSCKAVKSNRESAGHDLGGPIVDTGNGTPATPPGATPPAGVPPVIPTGPMVPVNPGSGATDAPAAMVSYLPDPLPVEVLPALTKPEALSVFTIRSIPIGQTGIATRQYRVDLTAKKLTFDSASGDSWTQGMQYALTTAEVGAIRTILGNVRTGTYPTCTTCKRDVHLLIMEGVENNKKAVSYAMSEPCTCGGNDERKATLPYATVKQLTDFLNR